MVRDFRTKPHLKLYARLDAELTARGAKIRVIRRNKDLMRPGNEAARSLDPNNLHIIEGGAAQGSGILNAAISYIQPFWHLDPKGILARSSIAKQPFDPATVNPKAAERTFARLHRRLVARRASRYSQQNLPVQNLPEGCIAVFLQAHYPQDQGTAHCTTEELLCAVTQGANGRPIIAKPHPINDPQPDLDLIARFATQGHDIRATDANVHDILQSCCATVSFNSAVALEGFLHHKPAILFGQSDFHHAATTLYSPADFSAALETALHTEKDHKAFLHWYFSQCLSTNAPDFTAKCIDIFNQAGFGADRLGLTG